jgi:hypothetical protein
MTHTIRRLTVAAALLVLVLMTAGSASGASRSFDVENHTPWHFTLYGVQRVGCGEWRDTWPGACDVYPNRYFPMEFEGRPRIDTDLLPGQSDDFELKYEYGRNLGGTPNYAAEIRYRRQNSTVTIFIYTTNYGRGSECSVSRTPGFDGRLRCSTNGGGTIRLYLADDD